MVIKAIVSYFTSILSNKGGVTGAALSGALTILGIQVGEIFASIEGNTDQQHLITSICLQGIFIMGFFLMSLANMGAGIQASKWENEQLEHPKKQFIDIDRLWYTLWKTLGIIILTFIITFVSIVLSYAGFKAMYWSFTWMNITIWSLGIMYEFYSIGCNIERKKGYKPALFLIAGKFIKVLEKGFVKRAENISFPRKESNHEEKAG